MNRKILEPCHIGTFRVKSQEVAVASQTQIHRSFWRMTYTHSHWNSFSWIHGLPATFFLGLGPWMFCLNLSYPVGTGYVKVNESKCLSQSAKHKNVCAGHFFDAQPNTSSQMPRCPDGLWGGQSIHRQGSDQAQGPPHTDIEIFSGAHLLSYWMVLFFKKNSFGPWPRPWKKLLLEFTTISIVTYMLCHTNNHVASPSSFKTLCFLWSITSKCGAFSVATWDSDQWANDQWSMSCWQQHPLIPLLLQKAMTFDCRVSNSSCLVGRRFTQFFFCLLLDPTLLVLLFLLDLEQLSSWLVTSDYD